MLSTILILIGFAVLIYGANFLVDGASALAAKFNVPNIVIGLTIVAFGTSSPELVVNSIAAMNGNTEIVLGNVIGSNIFNVAAILGISALIFPLAVQKNTTWIEIPLSLLAALVVLVLANDMLLDNDSANAITRTEGIVLLLFFLIFIGYNIKVAMSGDSSDTVEVKSYPVWKSVLVLVLGLGMLVLGGRLIVTHAVKIAQLIGLSERIIALTIVSIGTSLPELATSIVAVRKKNVDIAVGNVVGSNIFNIFFILGISATISDVTIRAEHQFDLLSNIMFGLLLFAFIFIGKGHRVERWEGILFILGYFAYIYLIF
jgi:cation:H+ antiporter